MLNQPRYTRLHTTLLAMSILIGIAIAVHLSGGQASTNRAATIGQVDISSNQDVFNLTPSLRYLRDPNNRVAFFDLLWQRLKPTWKPMLGEIPGRGYSDAAFWMVVDLKNRDDFDTDWFLELGYPPLDEIDIYVTSGVHVLQQYRTGDHLTFSSRTIVHRNFVMPLSIEAGQQLRLFIRIHTGSMVQVPVRLWNPTSFYNNDQQVTLGAGVYYGFMLVMALYNLFLYSALRLPRYTYYAAYILAFSAMRFCIEGFAFQHLWPEQVRLNELAPVFLLALTIAFMMLFVNNFLELRRLQPWGFRLNLGILATALCAAVGGFWLPYSPLLQGLMVLGFISKAAGLWQGMQRARSGDRVYQLFCLGWVISFIGALLETYNKLRLGIHNPLLDNSFQIGMILEIVFMALAFAEYISQQRQAQLAAQEDALRMEQLARETQEKALVVQREYSEALNQRGEELQQALTQLAVSNERLEQANRQLADSNEQLGQANQRLARQNHIDELTGIYNRRYFNEKFHAEFHRACRDQSPLTLMMFDIDFFKRLNDNHGHLAGDHCLVVVSETLNQSINRPADTVARYGGEEFVAILPNTGISGAVAVAEYCRGLIETLAFTYDGQTITLSVSVGIASLVPNHGIDPQQVISAADRALYRAKENGRNRVETAVDLKF